MKSKGKSVISEMLEREKDILGIEKTRGIIGEEWKYTVTQDVLRSNPDSRFKYQIEK
jgi:hypothetical protein